MEQKQKVNFKGNQQKERDSLNEEFSNEMRAFQEHWDEKIQNYQKECKQMEDELLEHNKKQLEEYR